MFSQVLHTCKQSRLYLLSVPRAQNMSNAFHESSDVFCCTHPKNYHKNKLMYGPVALEKRKFGKVFIVNSHTPPSQYKGSGCSYSGQKDVASFISVQGLVYRSPTRLIHKILLTRAEVSDTKPLINLIPMLKYVINTGRQTRRH